MADLEDIREAVTASGPKMPALSTNHAAGVLAGLALAVLVLLRVSFRGALGD